MRSEPFRRFGVLLLCATAVAVLFFGAVLRGAPPSATVSIDSPGNGDTAAGTVDVVVAFSIDKGQVHSLELVAGGQSVEIVAVHKKSGTHTFQLDTRDFPNGTLVIEARAYQSAVPADHLASASVTVAVLNPACGADADCDDGDSGTADTCQLPGTVSAVCVHAPIVCSGDSDCDDGDGLTTDLCVNPGTATASCSNESCAVACADDSGCDDGNPLTIDVCAGAGTCGASCGHTPVACNSASDCDDGNALTTDTCLSAGTQAASCSNVSCPVVCGADSDCADADALTIDVCAGAGTCGAVCSHTGIECVNDVDCDDGDVSTVDTCFGGGAPGAMCMRVPAVVEPEPVAEPEPEPESVVEPEPEPAPQPVVEPQPEPVVEPQPALQPEPQPVVAPQPEPQPDPVVEPQPQPQPEPQPEPVVEPTPTPVVEPEPVVEPTPEPVVEPEPESTPQSVPSPAPEPGAPLSLEVTAPENNEIVNTLVITVGGAVSPGAKVYINNTEATTHQGGFSANVSLIEGTNRLEVHAEKGGGVQTVTLFVTADTKPPEVLGMEPADGATLNESLSKIKVKIDDNPGGVGLDAAGLAVALDGSRIDGAYVLSSKSYEAAASGLAAGVHTVTVSARDKAGNEGAARTFAFTLTSPPQPGADNEPPRLAFVSLPGAQEKPKTPWVRAYENRPSMSHIAAEAARAGVIPPAEPLRLPVTAVEVVTPAGEVEALAVDPESGVDETTIELAIDGKKVPHTYDKQTGRVKYRPDKLTKGSHKVSLEASDTAGNDASATAAFTAMAESTAAVTDIRLFNAELGQETWTTVDIYEAVVARARAASGLTTLGCYFVASVYGRQESAQLSDESAPMAETSVGSGEYECGGTVSGRPTLTGGPANIVGVVIVDNGQFVDFSNDFLAYRDSIYETHFSNVSRSGASDIAAGETFEITAVGVPGEGPLTGALADAAILHNTVSAMPFQIGPELTETGPGSGIYTGRAAAAAIPSGVVEVRAMAIKDGSPVFSTEKLAAIAGDTTPPAAPVITSVDGVPVTDGRVASDNPSPDVAGTAEADAAVGIYEFLSGVSAGAITDTQGGAPVMSATHEQSGAVHDDFEDGNWQDKWRADNQETILEERNGVLVMRGYQTSSRIGAAYAPSNNADLQFHFQSPLESQVDFRLPSDDTCCNNPITGSTINLSFNVFQENDSYSFNLMWLIESETSSRLMLSMRDTGAFVNLDPPALDQLHTLKLSLDPVSGSVSAYLDDMATPKLTAASSPVDHGTVQMYLSAQAGQSPLSVEWDNFNTSVPMPSGYRVSAPALSVGAKAYDTLPPMLITPCEQSPQTTPTVSPCVTGEKDIFTALVTARNLSAGGAMLPEARLTLYAAGGYGAGDDQLEYISATLDNFKNFGLFSDYRIDYYGIALSKPAAPGDPYIPATDPFSAYQPLAVSETRSGSLRWDTEHGVYLASRTPLADDTGAYDGWVVFGIDPDSGSPILINADDTPITWADGSGDIDAAVAVAPDMGNLRITAYGPPEFIAALPGFGLEVRGTVSGVFTSGDAEQDYAWNQAALEAAGLTVPTASSITGGAYDNIGGVTASVDGGFSKTVETTFAEGPHTLTADATDADGNQSWFSAPVVYTLIGGGGGEDTAPPVISVTSHTEGQYINTNSPVITANITDDSGVDWESLTCEPTGCGIAHTEGTDQVIVTFTTPLPQGENAITITAADTASPQNTGSGGITLIIDTLPPMIGGFNANPVYVSPVNSPGVQDQTRISAEISDRSDFDWSLKIFNEALDIVGLYEGSNINPDFVWDGMFGAGAHPDGEYSALLQAMDGFNQYSEATVKIFIDNESPSVSITAPSPGEILMWPQQRLTASTSDNTGINKVEFLFQGAPYAASFCGKDETTPNIYYCDWYVSNVDNGAYEIGVRAYDLAGNSSDDVTTVELKNLSAPVLTITGVAPLIDGYFAKGAVSVTAQYSHENNIKGLILYLDGQPYSPEISVDGRIGEYTFEIDTTTLLDGEHSVFVSGFQDEHRRGFSEAFIFMVDNTPAGVTGTSPQNEEVVNSTALTLSVDVDDGNGAGFALSGVELKLDGKPVDEVKLAFSSGEATRRSLVKLAFNVPGDTVSEFGSVLSGAAETYQKAGTVKAEVTLREGTREAEILVTDRLGHETRHTWTFRAGTPTSHSTFMPMPYMNAVIEMISKGKPVRASEIATGRNPVAAAVAPNGWRVYTADAGADTVSVRPRFKCDENSFRKQYDVGDMPSGIAMTLTGGIDSYYAVNRLAGSFQRFSGGCYNAFPPTAIGSSPADVVFDAVTQVLYVSLSGENAIAAVDISEVSPVTRKIPLPPWSNPEGLALTLDGGMILAALPRVDKVIALNPADGTILGEAHVGREPVDLALHPTAPKLYVAERGSNTVAVIDMTNGTIVKRLSTGLQPSKLYVSNDGKYLYVYHAHSGKITAVDLSNDTMLGEGQ